MVDHTTEEFLLARQLDRLASDGYRHRHQTGILHHSLGATGDLVGRLVRSGTLHPQELTDGPAVEGPPRQGRLAWSVVPGGRRLEVVGDDGRPIQLIASDPPWYLDGLTLGPAQLPCTPVQLDLVLSMPAVAEEHLAAIDLKTALPAAPPPPVDQRPGVPEPHLVVWEDVVEDHRNWPWQTLPATLCVPYFRYGPAKVIPDGGLVVRHDGVRLVRDAAAEIRWMEQLGKLGLTSLPTGVEVRGRRRPPMRPLTAVPPRRHHEQRIELPPSVLTTLSAAGWRIERDGVAQAEPEVVEAIATRLEAVNEHGRDWFQLHLGVTLGDQTVNLIPLIAPLAVERSRFDALPTVLRDGRTWVLLTIDDRRVLRIPKDLLGTLLENLVELFDQGGTGEPRIAADDLGLLHDLGHTDPRWLGDERMRALVERLRGCLDPPPVPSPAGFTATLRPYQLQGLAWMQHLRRVDLGGVLADDMGLGKTVQAIAHLATEHAAGRLDRPALIVCPASMIGTWQRELARFAPGLTVRLLHGQDRPRSASDITGFHILITTYATLLRDADWLADLPLHLVLCDEAQALKNASAKAGDAVRRLDTRHRLALTGTPIENHLGEIYTLVDWLAPGLLGRRARFDRIFRMPIEKQGDVKRLALLRRRLAPVMLRRTKEAVAPELPAKTEQILSIPLGEQQRALYESVRAAMAAEVRKLLSAKGLRKGRLEILEALLRLRQVCCDPRLIKTGTAKRCGESAKLDTLADMLPELVEEGRRILLFSQFTGMLDLIESEVLAKAGLTWLRLDGSTPAQKRGALVDQFQQGKVHLFLISLKAGGTGLTLTAADTVIHYDPWWNPAVEDQATDRAHRIGQDKPVNVYRLVITGSIEERIQQLQRGKRALAEGLFDGTGQLSGGIDEAVLDELLQPLE